LKAQILKRLVTAPSQPPLPWPCQRRPASHAAREVGHGSVQGCLCSSVAMPR
jgi:hypothetical protein